MLTDKALNDCQECLKVDVQCTGLPKLAAPWKAAFLSLTESLVRTDLVAFAVQSEEHGRQRPNEFSCLLSPSFLYYLAEQLGHLEISVHFMLLLTDSTADLLKDWCSWPPYAEDSEAVMLLWIPFHWLLFDSGLCCPLGSIRPPLPCSRLTGIPVCDWGSGLSIWSW